MGTISFAAEQDIHAIRSIMDEAVAHLPYRDWFVDDDETYIARHIKENGYILKDVEENNVLAGYLIVDHPGYSEENLGRYLNLPSEEDLLRCAHMDSSCVLRSFQGRHILSSLLKEAIRIEKETFRTKYLLATAHPDNQYSIDSMIRCGFKPQCTFPKYNGWMRTLMLLTL